MRNGIERLKKRVEELKALNPQSIHAYRSAEIVKLEADIEGTLAAIFGERTPRFNRYRSAADLEPAPVLRMTPDWIAVRGGGYDDGVDIHELQSGIADRQRRAIALLEGAIGGLQEEMEHVPPEPSVQSEYEQPQRDITSSKLFLVHGRDDVTKNEVALFLRAIGLEPVILHLRPNGGRHLLTKFREESEGADFAVVLMTPDDEGGPAGASDRQPRARQNVVFELGFFIGKLGPARVAALLKGDVEKPSDFEGIAYIPFDSSGRWKTDLARELHHAKVPFDPAKAFTA
jgi:predicted nucleotide-binding protein